MRTEGLREGNREVGRTKGGNWKGETEFTAGAKGRVCREWEGLGDTLEDGN